MLWPASGIRSGRDVLRALAPGADGAMIGRAYVRGGGAMGKAGATRVPDTIRAEMGCIVAPCDERGIGNFRRRDVPMPADFAGHRA